MPPRQPSLRVRDVPRATGPRLLEIEGELDLSTADILGDALTSARGQVVVDLTGCLLIDSTGLALLLRTAQRLAEGSGALAVVVSDAEIRRLFEITGLDMTIAVHSTRDRALADPATTS